MWGEDLGPKSSIPVTEGAQGSLQLGGICWDKPGEGGRGLLRSVCSLTVQSPPTPSDGAKRLYRPLIVPLVCFGGI